MGSVYLATQTIAGEGRDVVVKEMLDYVRRADYTSSREYAQARDLARRRFEKEAGTLAHLSHTGIPRIYDYFVEGQRNYIVMECIAGRDLRYGLTHEDEQGALAEGTAYPQANVLRWGIELCRVLEYLAQQQPPVMHHDIKPANIILDKNSGTVRLVDFGTAKAQSLAIGGSVGQRQSSIYGTDGYAAPEMYRQESSPRSDVYSLAATLYHLLTDDDPRDHPFSFPKLDEVDTDVAQALRWALSNEPTERPTAAQLRAALELLSSPGQIQPFTFESGDLVYLPEALVPLADRYWDEARRYLVQRDLGEWFRKLHRNDLLAFIRDSQILRDPDAQLEHLLHRLDPTLPQPEVQVAPLALDFGSTGRGRSLEERLTVHVQRRGYAHLLLYTHHSWIEVEPQELRLWAAPGKPNHETVLVTLKTEHLPVGVHQEPGVEIQVAVPPGAPGGTAHRIAVEVEIARWPTLLSDALRFTTLAAYSIGRGLYAGLWVIARVVLALAGRRWSSQDLSSFELMLFALLLLPLLGLLLILETQTGLAFGVWGGGLLLSGLLFRRRRARQREAAAAEEEPENL